MALTATRLRTAGGRDGLLRWGGTPHPQRGRAIPRL